MANSEFRRRLYYALKPHIPWSVRVAARRIAAEQKLKSSRLIWPINPAASRPPENWPGWPGGSKFAFVITHDVKGPSGVANSQVLAEIEIAHGFRSSFNFVPEGKYSDSAELRSWLAKMGFEIGVHDLHHDGRLYTSRDAFRHKAQRINHYLEKWGASGFRSGFMLDELDWLHDLDIAYDASTFDTDPFEPQPDGAGTIFPFWVPAPEHRPGGRGYVELPYSLPQDSALFFLFRETSPDIWIRKLDWVAKHGGMALINVHPDYLRLDSQNVSPSSFPVAYYRQLLEHVNKRYGPSCWRPLPLELATWFRGTVRDPDRSASAVSAVAKQPHSVAMGLDLDSARLRLIAAS